jgi:hypothetical protein
MVISSFAISGGTAAVDNPAAAIAITESRNVFGTDPM